MATGKIKARWPPTEADGLELWLKGDPIMDGGAGCSWAVGQLEAVASIRPSGW